MSQYYDESLIEPQNQTRQRGCFFYGCLFAVILTLLVVVGGGIATYLGYRYVVNLTLPYTDTAPTPLPKVEMPPEEEKELHARVDAFRAALDSGEPTEPLVLDSDDINVLIAENEDVRDKVHVDLEGDKVKGQVSLPLEGIGIPAFKGRYLNGKATLKVSLEDGFLRVTLDALEVKGKPVPKNFIDQLRAKNLAEEASRNPDNAEAIRKLESIQVEDGKLIIKARAREDDASKEGNEADDNAMPDAETGDDAESPRGIFGEEPAKGADGDVRSLNKASRLVPGGGLAAHEAAGGHTLARHVGKTDADLAARLAAEPRISGASSFTDRAVAERAVSDALRARSAAIARWLSGSQGRMPAFEVNVGYDVGRSLMRGAASASTVRKVRIVLERDSSMATGYKIITAFPTP